MNILPALALAFFLITPAAVARTNGPSHRPYDPPPRIEECMARNIYYEARGASLLGMVAVGHVVLNRTADLRFPSDPCLVIHQREAGRCQFSWTCTAARHRRPPNTPEWRRARAAAYLVLSGEVLDITDNAIYFHSTSVRPGWRHLVQTARIDGHIFYKER